MAVEEMRVLRFMTFPCLCLDGVLIVVVVSPSSEGKRPAITAAPADRRFGRVDLGASRSRRWHLDQDILPSAGGDPDPQMIAVIDQFLQTSGKAVLHLPGR